MVARARPRALSRGVCVSDRGRTSHTRGQRRMTFLRNVLVRFKEWRDRHRERRSGPGDVSQQMREQLRREATDRARLEMHDRLRDLNNRRQRR